MMRIVTAITRRGKVGESGCGDVAAVFSSAGGTLLCVADGLGHGPQAEEAAERACEYVGRNADVPLGALLRGVDAALAGSRGAAVSLVSLQPGAKRVQFAGVGNVELRAAAHARVAPPTTPGIVGQGLRTVRVWDYPLAAGDLFVLTTDGVSSRFDLDALVALAPQAIADTLIARHHKQHDDGCCLVARVEVA
jgi:hypothetical protein